MINSSLDIKDCKDTFESVEDLAIEESEIEFPSGKKSFSNTRRLRIKNSKLAKILDRFPALESFRFEEDINKMFMLGLGSNEKFENLRDVYVDKRGTWTTLEQVQFRIQ